MSSETCEPPQYEDGSVTIKCGNDGGSFLFITFFESTPTDHCQPPTGVHVQLEREYYDFPIADVETIEFGSRPDHYAARCTASGECEEISVANIWLISSLPNDAGFRVGYDLFFPTWGAMTGEADLFWCGDKNNGPECE